MIAGIMFAVLATLVPAAYLVGRYVACERALTRILNRVLDPGMDVTEFVATLRVAQDEAER